METHAAVQKETDPSIPNLEDSPKNTESNDGSTQPSKDNLANDAMLRAPNSGTFDSEMDSLTRLLDSTLKIEESAPTASRSVVVPRGYRLSMEESPSDFYRHKAILVKDNKRKRDPEVFTVVSHRKNRYGFQPQEVLWYGAIYLKGCKPSNLTNEIHPLLRHSRFDDCPDAIYTELEPGLRLATMFLTQPICSQFWVTLMNGKREIDTDLTKFYGVNCRRIRKNVPMTGENTAAVIEYIKRLDEADMIHWSFKHNLLVNTDNVYGKTMFVCDNQAEFTKGPINTVVRHHIRLHADFYIVASKFSKLRHPNTEQKLRFSFFLAVIVCHELAHAIEGAPRRRRELGDDHCIEPWLFDDPIAEMGRAWESVTLGGTVHPINSAVDALHGIGTWDWPEADEAEGGRSLKYTVSMAYIQKIFQTETWQQEFELKDWKKFHIPRNGAVSINLNNFTTMRWSEEVRVEKEILEESLLMVQPATKRRATAKGESVTSSQLVGKEPLLKWNEPEPPILSQAKLPRRIRRPKTPTKQQPQTPEKSEERNACKDMGDIPSGRLGEGITQPRHDSKTQKKEPEGKPALEAGEKTKMPVAKGPATQLKIPLMDLLVPTPVEEQSSAAPNVEGEESSSRPEKEHTVIAKTQTVPIQKPVVSPRQSIKLKRPRAPKRAMDTREPKTS